MMVRRWMALLLPALCGFVIPWLTYKPFLHSVPDPVTLSEARLAPARRTLANTPRIGYVSSEFFVDRGERFHYHLALYALAPTVLELNPHASWMLVDSIPGLPPVPPDPAFEKKADLAEGLAVYMRKRS
jgi:hypothetical protein